MTGCIVVRKFKTGDPDYLQVWQDSDFQNFPLWYHGFVGARSKFAGLATIFEDEGIAEATALLIAQQWYPAIFYVLPIIKLSPWGK